MEENANERYKGMILDGEHSDRRRLHMGHSSRTVYPLSIRHVISCYEIRDFALLLDEGKKVYVHSE